MKPRTCPHCQEVLPPSSGFSFDGQMNLLCGSCQRIVFPATVQAEWQHHHQEARPQHQGPIFDGMHHSEFWRKKHNFPGNFPGDMWHDENDID
jgi:hypothetical protein